MRTIRHVRSVGFSLVEVTLALGVASIALIAIFGLLPVGLQNNHNSLEQSASTDLIAVVVADLRATPGNVTTSPQFGIDIPANPVAAAVTATLYLTTEGQVSPSVTGARYRLIITFPKNSPGAKAATYIDLKMTWPAAADPANALGSAEAFTAIDRN